jgi:hypothetical protein
MAHRYLFRMFLFENKAYSFKKTSKFSITTTFPGCYQIHQIADKQIHIVFDKGI